MSQPPIRDAARLIACGLIPSKRPSHDPDYEKLLKRHHDDPIFAHTVEDICRGLGLRLIDVSDYGIALGAEPESPFGFKLEQYKANLSVEERLLQGVIQVGIAAYLYPRAEDLEAEAEVRQVSVNGLDDYLREACQRLAQETTGEADPGKEHPELERAFRIFLRWPSTKQTAKNRRSAKTTRGRIAQALSRLADFGLLRRLNNEHGGTYQALRRYRVQVRELAGHEGLRALRKASQKPLQAEAPEKPV